MFNQDIKIPPFFQKIIQDIKHIIIKIKQIKERIVKTKATE